MCRFMPSVPGYTYAVRDDALYVNLFVTSSAELELKGGKVQIEQKTTYPWDGHVEITVTPQTAGQKFALHVRIPGWSEGQVFPSDLYTYLDKSDERPKLAVNGKPIDIAPQQGYAVIDRAWQPGDTVTLDLPMPVRRVVASDAVEADRGRVALVRGPIVYCIEWPDVKDGKVLNLVLPDDSPIGHEPQSGALGNIEVLTGTAQMQAAADATVRHRGHLPIPSPSRRSPTSPGHTAAKAKWKSGSPALRTSSPNHRSQPTKTKPIHSS